MNIVNLKQGTDEWHKWRNLGVSATDAKIVIGESLDKSRWRLWAEKVGKALPEDISANPHVRRGKANEDKARQLAEKAVNDGFLIPLCAEYSDEPSLRASLDGITRSKIPVELKCPCEKQWEEIKAEGVNSEAYSLYYIQVQHQILVTDAPYGLLFFYGPAEDGSYEMFKVSRDESAIQDIKKHSVTFMQHLIYGKEPMLDTNFDYFIPEDEDINEWSYHASIYCEIHSQMEKLKNQLEALEEQANVPLLKLKAMMDGYYRADFGGVNITRYERKGSVKYKDLLEQHSPNLNLEDVMDDFRRESTTQYRVGVSERMSPKNIIDLEEEKRLRECIANRPRAVNF